MDTEVGVSAWTVLCVCQEGRKEHRLMTLLNKIQMFESPCGKSAIQTLIIAAEMTDGKGEPGWG